MIPYIDPFQALRLSIQEELAVEHPFPPFLEKGAELLMKVHLYYRTYRLNQLYQDTDKIPSKEHPAIYGAALHLLHDYTQIGAYAVNIALTVKCAEDLLVEYRILDAHNQKLKEAINWQYPVYHPIQWKYEKGKVQETVSSPLCFIWQLRLTRFLQHIKHITVCALEVFKQLLKLSMCLCDAYLLFNNDPYMHYEACTELVAKWDHYLSELKTNQYLLVEEIERGQVLGSRILKHLGVDHESMSIISKLSDKIKKWMKENNGLLTDISHALELTLETIYIKGKITPLHIDLTAVHAATPKIPYSRFPPWAGQKTTIKHPPPYQSPLKMIEKGFLNFTLKFPDINWKD